MMMTMMKSHPSRRPSELNSRLTEGSPGFDSPSGSVLIISTVIVLIIVIVILIVIILIIAIIIVIVIFTSDNDTTELRADGTVELAPAGML